MLGLPKTQIEDIRLIIIINIYRKYRIHARDGNL